MFKNLIYEARLPDGRCYVGQTGGGLSQRRRQHERRALLPRDSFFNTKFARAIRKHGHETLAWRVLVVAEANALSSIEEALIRSRELLGAAGLNGSPGGGFINRGMKASAETRARIRAARARQVITGAHRKKIGDALRGLPKHPRVVAAMHAGARRWREEHPGAWRAAMERAAEKKRGRKTWNAGKRLPPISEAHRATLHAFNRGKKLTEEHKRKIGEANRLIAARKREADRIA